MERGRRGSGFSYDNMSRRERDTTMLEAGMRKRSRGSRGGLLPEIT